MVRQGIVGFPQKGSGGSENTDNRTTYTVPLNSLRMPLEGSQIGVGAILYYPAPITLSNKQDIKYPNISMSNASADNNVKQNVKTYGHSGYVVKQEEARASVISSVWTFGLSDVFGFFDRDVVHPAPSLLKCHSDTKYQGETNENI